MIVQEQSPEQKKVPLKLFSPYSNWTWYAIEFDPIEGIFFGLVHGMEKEMGYFSLEELENTCLGSSNLPAIERDCHWDSNTTLAEIQDGLKS